jgi:hypothetical protein
MHTDDEKVKEWLADREREALRIDPENAEVTWWYVNVSDPYDVHRELHEECIGRDYFARRPGGGIWVWFGDLPDATRERLWELHKRKLAFPAGLEELLHSVWQE